MSDENRIGMKHEATFGIRPAGGPRPFAGTHQTSIPATAWDGDATFACQECGTMLDTHEAPIRGQTENGVRLQGILCSGCGKSYTVELTKGAGGSDAPLPLTPEERATLGIPNDWVDPNA